jgi:glutamate carboxypeptidase
MTHAALTTQEQRLCAEISRRAGALLDDLRLFVEIPTGTGYTPGLDETRGLLLERCRALGASEELVPGDPRPAWLDYRVDRRSASASPPPTLICRRLDTGSARGRGVLIAGHLDTVHDPSGAFRHLAIAPDEQTATGPGCVDMKGGLVIAVHALEALEEAGFPARWSFLMNSDEETGSFHSERAIRAESTRVGASGEACYAAGLALEPAMSKGELAIARGGSGQFMLEAFGRSAHVGRDFAAGRSAVVALANAVLAASGLSDPARGLSVNIGPLRCDSPPNVVPDHAEAWGNVRFPAPELAEHLQRGLEALGSAPGSDLPRVEVHAVFNRPAKPCTPQTEALAQQARAVAEALGQRLPFAASGGVCDGNTMQAAGLPTIDTLGVRGGGLHTPQEWIELPSLVERCQLLAVLIARLGA